MTRGFEVVRTRSGGAAVRDLDTGEVMHPVIGAAREAHALYLEPSRLSERLERSTGEVVLFDVGLGAGANAAAAWRASEGRESASSRLSIVSFDRTPAAMALALSASERDALGFDDDCAAAARAVLEHGEHGTERTHWRLILGELPVTLPAGGSADVVFWDPFSPRANAELWTVAAFSLALAHCRPGGSLHTYSASTTVRTAMLLAGWAVGFGVATGSKAQTTIAARCGDDLDQPLDRRWLERLQRSSAPWPLDAPEDPLRRVQAAPQFAPG